MPSYLRHKPTGDIYPYCEGFAANAEFEPVAANGESIPEPAPVEPDLIRPPAPPKAKAPPLVAGIEK